MGAVKETAWAKVNLTLEILGRRDDGYHELQSLVGFTDFGDELRFEPGAGFKVETSGSFGDVLNEDLSSDNLVEVVGRALISDLGLTDFGTVYLDKRIPIAAGLGGGSADAAALIRLVMKVKGATFSAQKLAGLGKRFGADIPVCVRSSPSFMSGIGEVVEEVSSFPGFGILLVNPGVSLSTGAVFKALKADRLDAGDVVDVRSGGLAEFKDLGTVVDFMDTVPNDLLVPALAVEPVIGDVLRAIEALPHCKSARLSGSGATCFGVFETQDIARDGGSLLSEQFPNWWHCATRLRDI